MNTRVLHKYIDRKIETAISDKKDVFEVLNAHKEYLRSSTDSKIRPTYKDYMISFIDKRIEDIEFLTYRYKANINYKLISMLSTKDKICGLEEIDLVPGPLLINQSEK